MDKEKLLKLLKEHLRVDADFRQHTYGGSNELTIKLTWDFDTVIHETSVTVDPTSERGW